MSESNMGGFATLDWAILAGYFLIIVVTGVIFTKRQRSTDDYFLANRSIPMFAAAISFLATSLSAATFVGGPQQSYSGDLTYLSSNIGSIIAIIIVAVFFIPALYKQRVATVYGLLENRFGRPSSLSASGAFMIGRVFASGARLYIAALPASLILYGDIAIRHQLVAIALLTVVGIAYTYVGGIRTVIWTDVIQAVIFIGAALIAVVILYNRIPLD
ncbi:MAG: sodium:solute symporter, partial [Calditrichaeota bacterium]|nr:sodium:solute symporter [Calditrichota bacterium]